MKKILILAGVLLVACIVVIVAAAALGIGLTQPAATAGDAFMTALRDGSFAQAYALCGPDLQKELGTAADLQSMIESNNVTPTAWTFNSRNVSGNQGELDGTLTLTGNRTGTVHLTLSNLDGKWQVVGFNLKQN